MLLHSGNITHSFQFSSIMLQLHRSPMRSLHPEHSEIKRYHRREHLIMILGFIISWGPFAWIYIPTVFGFSEKPTRTTNDIVPLLMVKLGCALINPIVYVFENYEVHITYHHVRLNCRFKSILKNEFSVYPMSTRIPLVFFLGLWRKSQYCPFIVLYSQDQA